MGAFDLSPKLSHSAVSCLSGDAGNLFQRQVGSADRGRPVHRGGHTQRVSLKPSQVTRW